MLNVSDYMAELLEWGPCFTLWANSEDQLTGALLTMSKAVDDCLRSLKELVSYESDSPNYEWIFNKHLALFTYDLGLFKSYVCI